MINLHKRSYKYYETLNLSILKCMPKLHNTVKTVLDVGSGSGLLAEVLRERGYQTVGIDNNIELINTSKTRISEIINLDLTNKQAVDLVLKNRKFDYILFSDVLEHLYDPFETVCYYLKYLKQDGQIIVSVPNILVWAYRFKMLIGKFEYRDSGVMDRTHIRFFTFKTAKDLLIASGCKIVKVDYVPYFTRGLRRPLKKLVGNKRYSEIFSWYLKYLYPIEYVFGYMWKSMFGFRIILIGEKK